MCLGSHVEKMWLWLLPEGTVTLCWVLVICQSTRMMLLSLENVDYFPLSFYLI